MDNMEQEKIVTPKRLSSMIFAIIGLIAITMGVSYAWLTLTLTGTKTQVLKAGTLELTLDESTSNGINLDQVQPITDAKGMLTTSYTFTLENTGDFPVKYQLSLDDQTITGTRMPDTVVKYWLKIDGEETGPVLLSTMTDRLIDSGYMDVGDKKSYELKLWIDYSAGNEIQGTKFNAKLNITGSQLLPGESIPKQNILAVYKYDQTNASTFCVTGEESTCVELEYSKDATYEKGTIVHYQVNDSESYYFHVLYDNGDTLTMQQRENTTALSTWYSSNDNTQGPLVAIQTLETETSDWNNVNVQTYTMGTTVFGNADNSFTGCSTYNSCTTNTYVWPTRTARARMITAYETTSQGCNTSERSCPIYMYNYLSASVSYGGTVNGSGNLYWTMSARSDEARNSWVITYRGYIYYNGINVNAGVRAVVVINK